MNFRWLIHPPYWICDWDITYRGRFVERGRFVCDVCSMSEAYEFAGEEMRKHLRHAGGAGDFRIKRASIFYRVFRALFGRS